MYRWTQTWNTYITAISTIIIFFGVMQICVRPRREINSDHKLISCQKSIRHGLIDVAKCSNRLSDKLYTYNIIVSLPAPFS